MPRSISWLVRRLTGAESRWLLSLRRQPKQTRILTAAKEPPVRGAVMSNLKRRSVDTVTFTWAKIRFVFLAAICAGLLGGCGGAAQVTSGLCPPGGCASVAGVIERCDGATAGTCAPLAVRSVSLLDLRGQPETIEHSGPERQIHSFDLIAEVPGRYILEATTDGHRIAREVELRYGHVVRADLVLCRRANCGASAEGENWLPFVRPDRDQTSARPPVPTAEQVDPHMTPTSGGRHTVFTVSFTVREPLGRRGNTWYYYDVGAHPSVALQTSDPHACWGVGDQLVGRGKEGKVVNSIVGPKSHGWCVGTYELVVAYDAEPYCFYAHRPCAEMDSYLATPNGYTYFTVR
jgi:hypothetical protein